MQIRLLNIKDLCLQIWSMLHSGRRHGGCARQRAIFWPEFNT